MENKIHLSVVIPAYNEEKRIATTLLDVDKYLSEQKYNYEIIVVNGGSKDNTVQVVNKMRELVKNLYLIDIKENRGKGWVVKNGILEAKGEYRVFMDADNATTIDHIEKFWPFFKSGYDVIIGSRTTKGTEITVHQPWYKELAGKFGNKIIQIFAVWGINDTQCGFKSFTQKSAKDIFEKSTINGWGFDVEVLALARALNYKIKEMPVIWRNDPESHVKFKSYFEVLWQTLKVRYNLIIDKYKIKNNTNGKIQ